MKSLYVAIWIGCVLALGAAALGALALFFGIHWSEWMGYKGFSWPLALVALTAGGASTLLGIRLVGRLGQRKRCSVPAEQVSRRDVLKFVALQTALGGVTLSGIRYSTHVEPYRLQVEEIEVPVPGLSSRLEGLRIVQLSDLHLGHVAPLAHVHRAVALAQKLSGELIVCTGDYGAPACAEALSVLRAPLGVYAILGNHDHWDGAACMSQALQAAGLVVLRNRGVGVARDAGPRSDLWLAGLDDVWEEQHDLERALQGAPPDAPVLLLVHEPDYALQVASRASVLGIVLQLSGHSHGGQVRLPLLGAPILPYLGKQYPVGLQRAGQMWVYTSRGVGMITPAVRFNCRPEVTALTLRRA